LTTVNCEILQRIDNTTQLEVAGIYVVTCW